MYEFKFFRKLTLVFLLQTRLLVTHGISFLPQVDMIFVFKDGHLSESGSFQQLLDHAAAFSEFLKTHFQEAKDDLTEEGRLMKVEKSVTAEYK